MIHDWLLVETLGLEPAVVAQGRRTQNLIPISKFLRRNPHLMAIQTAIGETVRAGQGLSSITPKNDCVIRTEVVQMTDGRIHGVHLWVGPPDVEPPERPVPGALVWDLGNGTAMSTEEALRNSGWRPESTGTHHRALADLLPKRSLHPREAKVLAMVIRRQPGETFCSTWDITDYRGEQITVGFVTRALSEPVDGDEERLVCRSMNWRSEREDGAEPHDYLAQQILHGLAQPGVHRALVDPTSWTLLKWLDDPVPFFNWRTSLAGEHQVHPADRVQMARMAEEFMTGTTTGVLRMVAEDGEWTPVHVTVNRVELEDEVYAALASLRRPTAEEIAVSGVAPSGDAAALPEPG